MMVAILAHQLGSLAHLMVAILAHQLGSLFGT
jgi:hypothetical protein